MFAASAPTSRRLVYAAFFAVSFARVVSCGGVAVDVEAPCASGDGRAAALAAML